jgi:hypothetical protein
MKTNSQTIAPGVYDMRIRRRAAPEPGSPFAYLLETAAPVVVVPDPPDP